MCRPILRGWAPFTSSSSRAGGSPSATWSPSYGSHTATALPIGRASLPDAPAVESRARASDPLQHRPVVRAPPAELRRS
eukprot:10973143-Alexandrium_andersonii.AAC.1